MPTRTRTVSRARKLSAHKAEPEPRRSPAPRGGRPRRADSRVLKTGRISTLQFVAYVLLVVVGATLYVGHVHASEALITEVQQIRNENLRLTLRLNRLKGDFDRMTGPSVIIERAKKLGLKEGFAYGATIVVDKTRG